MTSGRRGRNGGADWSGPAKGDPPLAGGASRWIGWIALSAALVLAGAWALQDWTPPDAEANASSPPAGLPEHLEGFRAEASFLPDDSLLGFVHVPEGPFVVGSDPSADPMAYDNERWSAEQAQDTLDLSGFYMGRHEVTVAQFRAFVEDAGPPVPREALEGPLDHPATHVTWPDALTYARWLDARLRESERAPAPLRRLLDQGWRVDLPTELQWEKAARGPDGRVFPWGGAPRPDRANFGGDGPRSVGSFDCPECPYGLTDMSGNVWEWTRSPYQAYPYSDSDDRGNLDEDALWVIRGGSYQDPPQNVRAAVRGGGDPGARRPFVGFRIVLTP